eukprot:TRINITY_DN4448_c0_g1_i6.p1 TRINITY_DN4448_c0_g1~~TRINITY_DN4448_c0_g1_i6.p1  ORF type:complete len:191 (-),score=27.48 TRINITY_DN4448_c0_g1_i6:169-684(-)
MCIRDRYKLVIIWTCVYSLFWGFSTFFYIATNTMEEDIQVGWMQNIRSRFGDHVPAKKLLANKCYRDSLCVYIGLTIIACQTFWSPLRFARVLEVYERSKYSSRREYSLRLFRSFVPTFILGLLPMYIKSLDIFISYSIQAPLICIGLTLLVYLPDRSLSKSRETALKRET